MADLFASHQPGLTAPAASAAALTPTDAADLPRATRALYVGTAGDLHLRLTSGDEVTLTNAAAGMIYPLRITRVFATGTTAGALVGLS